MKPENLIANENRVPDDEYDDITNALLLLDHVIKAGAKNLEQIMGGSPIDAHTHLNLHKNEITVRTESGVAITLSVSEIKGGCKS